METFPVDQFVQSPRVWQLTSFIVACWLREKEESHSSIQLVINKTLLTEYHCPDLLQYSITVFKEKNIYLVVTEKIKRKYSQLRSLGTIPAKIYPSSRRLKPLTRFPSISGFSLIFREVSLNVSHYPVTLGRWWNYEILVPFQIIQPNDPSICSPLHWSLSHCVW